MAKTVSAGGIVSGGTYANSEKLYVKGGTANNITIANKGTVYVQKGLAKAKNMKDIAGVFKKELGDTIKVTKNAITFIPNDTSIYGLPTVERAGNSFKLYISLNMNYGYSAKGKAVYYNNMLSGDFTCVVRGQKGNISISSSPKKFSLKGSIKGEISGYPVTINFNNASMTGKVSGKKNGYSFTITMNNYKSDYTYTTVSIAGAKQTTSSYDGYLANYNQTKKYFNSMRLSAQGIIKIVASLYSSYRKPKDGLVQGATVKRGGALVLSSCGIAKNTTVLAGGSVCLDGGSLSGKSTLGGNLLIMSAGGKIGKAETTASTKVRYDLVEKKAGGSVMLAGAKQNFAAKFFIMTAKNQQIGTYKLSNGLYVKAGTSFAIQVDGASVGSAQLGGAELAKNGMTYKFVVGANNGVNLVTGIKEGISVAGKVKGGNLRGTNHSDLFIGGEGNDQINGANGRDVVLYGKEKWGKDVINKTSGTMSIVFNGISKSSVTQSLSGSTMTITRNSDKNQMIKIEGWNSGTHNIVFGKEHSQYDAWLNVADPGSRSQITASVRREEFKSAGLASV